MSDRLQLIRDAVAKDGANIEDAYADRAWLLAKVDRLEGALRQVPYGQEALDNIKALESEREK